MILFNRVKLKLKICNLKLSFGPVAQLARARQSQCRGQGFKSLQVHHPSLCEAELRMAQPHLINNLIIKNCFKIYLKFLPAGRQVKLKIENLHPGV